jgi:adenylylsulfate kinase-like enzyme
MGHVRQWAFLIGRNARRSPRRLVVAISGPVRSGKTTLAERLAKKLHAEFVRTKEILIYEYGPDSRVRLRRNLQDLGEQLDRETDGRWVASAVVRRSSSLHPKIPIVIDAVRIQRQLDWLRRVPELQVVHVHLDAPLATLTGRYEAGAANDDAELPSYEQVRQNATESQIGNLRSKTRLRFGTARVRPWLLAFLVIVALTCIRLTASLRDAAIAFLVGVMPAAMLTVPLVWFWEDQDRPLDSSIGANTREPRPSADCAG